MLSDYNNPIDGGMTSGGGLPGDMRAYLLTAGKWGKFISIIGLIFLGLGVVMMLFTGGAMMSAFGSVGGMGSLSGLMIIPYLLFFALMIYVYYHLYLFSTKAITASNGDSMTDATTAMKSMATIMKVVGVLTAIYMALMALVIIGGIAGGVAGAF